MGILFIEDYQDIFREDMRMRRVEFMRELSNLLQDLSDADREEALRYYNDYFEDAGPENEEAVAEELGTPEKVAAMI